MSGFNLVKLIDPAVQLSTNVTPKGEYSNSTTYFTGDTVTYNGINYIAKVETTGNIPTNSTYWQVLYEDSAKYTKVRNQTGATIYKGTIVYISGSTGTLPLISKAKADSDSTSARTFGVVYEDIANNSDGRVLSAGPIDTLDTRTTATNPFTSDTLVDGDVVYLDPTTAGYVTNVKPSAPNHLVYVGFVVKASPTTGTIIYRIQNGYELEELHNVAISSVANNDTLVYESSTNLWKNKAISTVTGPASSTDSNIAVFDGTTGKIIKDGGILSSNLVTLAGTQTLTNKTLTSPKVGTGILDSNGNTSIALTATASAVNYLTVTNGATGQGVQLYATGSDTNISWNLYSKGTGAVNLRSNTNGVAFSAAPVASGVNYVSAGAAATGNAPYLLASGTDTNINLNLTSKGTGTVQANGVDIVTTSGTQTLTNKTISGSSNTFSNIQQSAVTNLTTNLAAKADVLNGTDHQALGASGKPAVFSSSSLGAPGSFIVDPRQHNYLMYANLRGATVTVLKNGSTYPSGDILALSNMFTPDASNATFSGLVAGDVITIEVDFTALGSLYAGNVFGFDARYYQTPANVTIEAWDSVNLVWETVGSTTSCQGTYAKAWNSATYKTKVRYTLSSFPQITYTHVASLYIANVSGGPSDGYFPRGGGSLYGTNAAPPNISAAGSDANISINIVPKGTGTLNQSGVPVVTTTGTQTLTNKTLSSPTFSGTLAATNPRWTSPLIINGLFDSSGNAFLGVTPTASAVNYLQVTNSATGNPVSIAPAGSDTNIHLNLLSKGTGSVLVNNNVIADVNSAQTLTNKTLTSPKITSGNAPATATSTGTTGQIEWDANYVYICTATNTWKRAAIATW